MTQQTGEPHKKLQQNTVLYNQYIWNSSDEYWFFIYQQYLHKKILSCIHECVKVNKECKRSGLLVKINCLMWNYTE
jgi:hypothetical protein